MCVEFVRITQIIVVSGSYVRYNLFSNLNIHTHSSWVFQIFFTMFHLSNLNKFSKKRREFSFFLYYILFQYFNTTILYVPVCNYPQVTPDIRHTKFH